MIAPWMLNLRQYLIEIAASHQLKQYKCQQKRPPKGSLFERDQVNLIFESLTYLSNAKTDCGAWLAWANMAVPAC
jgi:hypothetical protein